MNRPSKTRGKSGIAFILCLAFVITSCNLLGGSNNVKFVPVYKYRDSDIIYLEFSDGNSSIPDELYSDKALQKPVNYPDFIQMVSDNNDISIVYATRNGSIISLVLSRDFIPYENLGIKINETTLYGKSGYSLSIPKLKILYMGYIDGYEKFTN